MKDNQIKSVVTGLNKDGTRRVIKVWGAYTPSQASKLMQDIEGGNYKNATVMVR